MLSSVTGAVSFVAFIALGLPADRLHEVHPHGPAAASARIAGAAGRCPDRRRVLAPRACRAPCIARRNGVAARGAWPTFRYPRRRARASRAEHPDEHLYGRLRIDQVAQDEARMYDVVFGPEIGVPQVLAAVIDVVGAGLACARAISSFASSRSIPTTRPAWARRASSSVTSPPPHPTSRRQSASCATPTRSSSSVVLGAMTRATRRSRSRPSGPPRMM